MKKGNVWNTAFQRRYFKLWTDRKLYYFKKETDANHRGVIDLNELQSVNKKDVAGFEIVTVERVWQCLCDNEDQRDSWCSVIENVCNL